jgi:hypothetical protein
MRLAIRVVLSSGVPFWDLVDVMTVVLAILAINWSPKHIRFLIFDRWKPVMLARVRPKQGKGPIL